MAKSIIQEIEWECYLCGKKATETHHLINGNGLRKKADQDGLVIRLCRDCHCYVHANFEMRENLKKIAQEKYEETHSREEWFKRYHKNYL